MTKVATAYVISENDKEMFINVGLNDGKELHITIDKMGENHHVYLWDRESYFRNYPFDKIIERLVGAE